jgi:hypothetical protein
MVRCTWYNFIWFLNLTDGEVYLIELYLIFDFQRWCCIKYTSPSVRLKNQIKLYQVHLTIGEIQKSDKVVSSTPHHRWWGVLDTTLSDFWLSPMVRCTWYNFIWFLNLTDGEMYLIQLYLIFYSHRWWGVLDTTLSDFWLSPMVRGTWYNFIRWKSKIR